MRIKIVADFQSFRLTYEVPMKSKFDPGHGWTLEYLLTENSSFFLKPE